MFFRQNSLRIVILRACDFFDLYVFSAYLTGCFSVPSQIRHPERSAVQIYRTTNYLWRGVEGPRRCLLAHAVRSFPTTNYKPNLKKSQALSGAPHKFIAWHTAWCAESKDPGGA